MKNKKYILFIALLLFLPYVHIQAYCTDNEIIRMSKIAQNVNLTPEFREDKEKFDLIITNLHPDIYMRDINNDKDYRFSNSDTIIENLEPFTNYRFKLLSAKSECDGQVLLSKYIVLPGYNPFYKDPLCNDLTEYSFCQKWVSHMYTKEQFLELINQKKMINQKLEKSAQKKEVMGIYDYMGNFYSKYYYIILPMIIVICLIIIIRSTKNKYNF